jgi:ATP-binding cassette subfamily B protein
MPVDQFVLLFAAIGGFSGWVIGLLNEYSTLQRHSFDFCRLREFLEFPDMTKRTGGKKITTTPGKTHRFDFNNVSFRYPGAAQDTLKDINLTINKGEKLAVVGLNGAGKTTLIMLLCGFFDPTGGVLHIDGKDVRLYNREQYTSIFTAVFQEFNILPVSIAENVAQAGMKEINRERLWYCLELAGLSEKIKTLGIETLMRKDINDEAAELSGGETQRLMLARALYKDSSVLILDEPTAALDPIAESRLYEQYNVLSSGKTSIFISHRLASTRFCDRIIFMDNHTIAEYGTHDELMAAGGKYAKLYEIQSRYYKEGAEM